MTEFEPWASGFGSYRSANWATSTAPLVLVLYSAESFGSNFPPIESVTIASLSRP